MPFYTGAQPKVVLLDLFGSKQEKFCANVDSCYEVMQEVTATLFNNPGCTGDSPNPTSGCAWDKPLSVLTWMFFASPELHGNTIVTSRNGVAAFTDLMISEPGASPHLPARGICHFLC